MDMNDEDDGVYGTCSVGGWSHCLDDGESELYVWIDPLEDFIPPRWDTCWYEAIIVEDLFKYG